MLGSQLDGHQWLSIALEAVEEMANDRDGVILRITPGFLEQLRFPARYARVESISEPEAPDPQALEAGHFVFRK